MSTLLNAVAGTDRAVLIPTPSWCSTVVSLMVTGPLMCVSFQRNRLAVNQPALLLVLKL